MTDNYKKEMAARDAVLHNTSDARLRKRVMAENTDFDSMIKLGLADEHTNIKADQIGNTKDEDMLVRRMMQEEVNQENHGAKVEQSIKTQCQTCSRNHFS